MNLHLHIQLKTSSSKNKVQSSRLVLDILVLTIKHNVFKTNNKIPTIFFRCFSISQQQVNEKKMLLTQNKKKYTDSFLQMYCYCLLTV